MAGEYCFYFDPVMDPFFSKTLYRHFERNGLSEEDFFAALQKTPAYLATPLFQEKIEEWLHTLHANEFSKAFLEITSGKQLTEIDRENAKKNLQGVGTALAHEKSGRKEVSKTKRFEIYKGYEKAYSWGKKFRSAENRNHVILTAKKEFPHIKDFKTIICGRGGILRHPQDIAYHLLAAEYGVSYDYVKKLMTDMKRCRREQAAEAKKLSEETRAFVKAIKQRGAGPGGEDTSSDEKG